MWFQIGQQKAPIFVVLFGGVKTPLPIEQTNPQKKTCSHKQSNHKKTKNKKQKNVIIWFLNTLNQATFLWSIIISGGKMQVAYQLKADELDLKFIKSIKNLFGNRQLDIVVNTYEYRNDTEYLLANKKNSKRLLESITAIENNKEKLIHKTIEDLG